MAPSMRPDTPEPVFAIPHPPLYLPSLPRQHNQYFKASDLVESGEQDEEEGTEETGLSGLSHHHRIKAAYLDDDNKLLCWHFRPVMKILTPANSDYPGRYLYACHYYESQPRYDCQYRELDFHHARRARKKQPLVAPTIPIVFPPGHVPHYLPERENRTSLVRRYWETNDPLDLSDINGPGDEPAAPDDQQVPPQPEEDDVFEELEHLQQVTEELSTQTRYNDRDQQQSLVRMSHAQDIHERIQQLELPDSLTPDQYVVVVHGYTFREIKINLTDRQRRLAAQELSNVTEEGYEYESWEVRLANLMRWFRHEGKSFALPFLIELLENSTLLGDQVKDGCLRLLRPLICTADDAGTARPDDEGKADRMNDALDFITGVHREPLMERRELLSKAEFIRDMLAMKEMQDAYAAYQLPWSKMVLAADEVLLKMSKTIDAQDFDESRLWADTYERGQELLAQAMPAYPRIRAWTGTADDFAA